MFCARLFICALWSPAGKGLTSWLSFVVSSVSLSLSHWYSGSGVVLDCMDSWSLHHYLLLSFTRRKKMPLKSMSTWNDVPWYFREKESYLSWLTFINVDLPYMQQTYFHLIMYLHLLYFPMHSLYAVLVHLKCWNRANYFPSDKRARFITAGKAMQCRMNRS